VTETKFTTKMEEEKSALENLTEPDDRDSLNQDSEEEKKSALENLMELHDQDSEEEEKSALENLMELHDQDSEEEEKSALENLMEFHDQDSEEKKKSALENLMELHDQDSEEDEEEFFFWTHESPDINISKEFLANIFFMVPTAFVFMLSIIIFFSGFR